MLYRVKQTGEVKTQGEVRGLFPNTSLPAVWDLNLLETLGVDPVFEAPTPTVTEYQTYSEDGVELIDGKWFKKYVVVDFDQEAIDAVNAAKVKDNKEKAARLLSESDFYDLPNTSVKIDNIADILAYRDALRAIALNPTLDAVFPTKPATVWK